MYFQRKAQCHTIIYLFVLSLVSVSAKEFSPQLNLVFWDSNSASDDASENLAAATQWFSEQYANQQLLQDKYPFAVGMVFVNGTSAEVIAYLSGNSVEEEGTPGIKLESTPEVIPDVETETEKDDDREEEVIEIPVMFFCMVLAFGMTFWAYLELKRQGGEKE